MKGSAASLLAALFACACSDEAPARGQLLVEVDTDAPIVAQLAADPTLSSDASIDTLRVDVLAADGTVADSNVFVAPEVDDWPLSFGVRTLDGGAGTLVRIRLRAFGARFAQTSTSESGTTLDPRPGATIERVVELALPNTGVSEHRVVLHGDCMSARPDFERGTTCIDAERPDVPFSMGIERPTGSTVVGTWPAAREVPCAGSGPPGAICIPGGFTLLGSPNLAERGELNPILSTPLVPARLSPFWLDRTELTVARFRDLLPSYEGELPDEPGAGFQAFCTWPDAANDDYALTCIAWIDALLACRAAGGTLPSEARWEHAARGRGQRRTYPWGDEDPRCCTASMGRQIDALSTFCSGFGPEPVGSHTGDDCGGTGDVSRDGVLDLAGGVLEWMLDQAANYDEPCWAGRGVRADPVCTGIVGDAFAARGSSYEEGPANLPVAGRETVAKGANVGFRCAYEDQP